MASDIKIAVCINENGWHTKFASSLEQHSANGHISYALVNIDSADWLRELAEFDAVIWKPHYMGVEASSYLKEKVWFIERFLKKLIVPNYDTVWHFESKVAQSYIFDQINAPHPKTVASFDRDDAVRQLDLFSFPIVFKKSYGAASTNVKLIGDKETMLRIINSVFSRRLVKPGWQKKILPSNLATTLRYFADEKIWGSNQRCAYWQEFIPGNSRDLRITVIGSKFAFGFYRNNRPNDFRASGSGSIDYSSPVPEEVIRYCLELNRRLNFDSMAYDLVFSGDGSFRILEMSYGYVDTAIYSTPGHFEMNNGSLEYVNGHCWPQELWVRWLLERIRLIESDAERQIYR